MSKDGMIANVYEVKTLPATARELVEAIQNQKDLSKEEALEMADYFDDRYGMSPYVPTGNSSPKAQSKSNNKEDV